MVIILIGNKADLTGQKEVRKEDGEAIARVRWGLGVSVGAFRLVWVDWCVGVLVGWCIKVGLWVWWCG